MLFEVEAAQERADKHARRARMVYVTQRTELPIHRAAEPLVVSLDLQK